MSNPTFSFAEWEAYTADPSAQSLAALETKLQAVGRRAELHIAVQEAFRKSGHWKSAQHLALLFIAKGYASYAMYYAARARESSNEHPLARLMFAKVVWMRRIPGAVLFETDHLHAPVRRIRDKKQRRDIQIEIAELNICAHAYSQSMHELPRWLKSATRNGRALSRDTALQLLLGANAAGNNDLCVMAARMLAPLNVTFGGRVQAIIKKALYHALLSVLRQKP